MMGKGDPYVMRPQKSLPFKKDFIQHFDWKQLNGKVMNVIVVEDGGFQSVSLYEANTKKIYVVAVNKLEEN